MLSNLLKVAQPGRGKAWSCMTKVPKFLGTELYCPTE